jgi:hypothetical protein
MGDRSEVSIYIPHAGEGRSPHRPSTWW